VDILSSTIATIRTGSPSSGLFVRHAPWGRRYPLVPGAGFHVVLDGSCWLLPPDGAPVALAAGDVVFMPRGAEHALADRADSPLTETAHPGEPRVIDGPGARSTLLCGAYDLARAHTHPLLAELPEFVHLPARAGRRTPLRSVVDLLVAEVSGQPLGSDAAVPALLDTMLLFLLRAWLDEPREHVSGWAAALSDSAVAAALRAIHDDPAHSWTVSELAGRAMVSRATLARRFATTIGEPPLSYLTRWRMLLAARLLRETADPLATVARTVGYGSEFAFAKAFKRHHGSAPGSYRKQAVRLPSRPDSSHAEVPA
jgi:AraC-like DNA-binding protein